VDKGAAAVDEGAAEAWIEMGAGEGGLPPVPPKRPRMGADPSLAEMAFAAPASWWGAAGQGLIVVAVFLIGAIWATKFVWPFLGPPAAFACGGVVLAAGVACAAVVVRDRLREQALHAREERHGMAIGPLASAGETWDQITLARARRDLEAAIVSRFGPLDEARREKLRAYDQQALDEAARRLPDAATLDDLGP